MSNTQHFVQENRASYSKFGAATLMEMASRTSIINFPKNTVIMSEGETSNSLYLIMAGQVKTYVSDEHGKELILNIHGPGEYIGELALFDTEPALASVIALESVKLMAIPKDELYERVLKDSKLTLTLLEQMTGRIRQLTERIRDLALKDVYNRVSKVLLTFATQDGNVLVVDQRLTQQYIANMAGASQAMVSKILKELTTGGYISNKNGRFVINGKLPKAW